MNAPRTRRPGLARLLCALAAATALGAAWTGTASAASAPAVIGAGVSTAVSWQHGAVSAAALPPPHDSSRGACTPSRNGTKIALDCTILKADTTLWVACSGGFVEIRHLPVGRIVAEGTCPQYGGYALTATSPD
ncbi:hypothetical protein GCM10027168_20680 [Streptomyces capparidis]